MDPNETNNLAEENETEAKRLMQLYESWSKSVNASAAGEDYGNDRKVIHQREPVYWRSDPRYTPHLDFLNGISPKLRTGK
jgi:hypothetical protein